MAKGIQQSGSGWTTIWDETAFNYMIARKHEDGTMGYMINDKQHGKEWYRYFQKNGLKYKAAALTSAMRQDRSYMVPTEWPEQYDPEFKPNTDRYEIEKPITPEKRQENYDRFVQLVANIGRSGDLFQEKLKSLKPGESLSVPDWIAEEKLIIAKPRQYKDD